MRFAIVGLVVFSAPLWAQVKADSTPPAQTLAELRHQLDSIATKYRVPGAGVALVSRDSIVWAGGVGVRDLATKAPVTATTQFRVGSISKMFVSLGLLRLVEQGRLSLDAPIRSLIPEIAIDNPWEATHPITVAMVLEHTAGFDDMRFNEMYVRPAAPDRPMVDVLSINPKSRRVRWEPGTRFSYSNPGYGIAGYLLEKLTRMPYDQYLQDSVLAALGMTTGSYRLTDADTAAIAQGYNGTDPKPVGYPHIFLRPAGNLHTTPTELAKAVRMFLNRGMVDTSRFLRPETIDRMERTETTVLARHGVKTGYGLANYHTLSFPVSVSGHSGGIDGFASELQYAEGAGVGWVVLVNGGEGPGLGEMVNAAGRFMLKDVRPIAAPVAAVPAASLTRYQGYYRAAAPRSALFAIATDLMGGTRVVLRADTLFQSPLIGRGEALIPTGEGTFRLGREPVTARAFIELPNGGMIYASGGDYWERTSMMPLVLGIVALGAALVLIGVALVHALGWVPRRLLGRIKAGPATAVRAWPLAAVLSLVGFVIVALEYGVSAGATMNGGSLAILGFSLLFPVLSIVALFRSWRAGAREAGPGARRLGILVSLACVGLAGWLGVYGFVGLMTWRF